MIDSGVRDVTKRVRKILATSPLPEIRHIQVEQDGDRLYLHGRVPTFYAKQMAQEAVRQSVRGMQLVNDIDVD